jgi:hypothetical protein
VTFKVKRERSAQYAEDCKTAFASIVLQCIGRQNFASGLVRNEVEGVVYEVYHVSDGFVHEHEDNPEHVLQERDQNDPGRDNSLETRMPKSNKGASKIKAKQPRQLNNILQQRKQNDLPNNSPKYSQFSPPS